jgi:5-methylthioadenosine/S-adenosylhomocysteine deaminase
VAPLAEYLAAGVNVALGADGACSSDAQDMHEVMKYVALLHTLRTREYRQWLEPRQVLRLGTEGGYAAVALQGQGGVIREGALADVTLYDLTALALLPRSDPIATLVLGRPVGGVGGEALHSIWVNGRRLLAAGVPQTVDVGKLRADLAAVYPCIRSRGATDPARDPYTAAVEREYRAAMGLEGSVRPADAAAAAFLADGYPGGRALDDRTSFP